MKIEYDDSIEGRNKRSLFDEIKYYVDNFGIDGLIDVLIDIRKYIKDGDGE